MEQKKKFGLIGYACGVGGKILGAKEGPRVLRSRNLIETLKKIGVEVADFGDAFPVASLGEEEQIREKATPLENRALYLAAVYVACKNLHKLTLEALEKNYVPLILGGDHSLSIGSISAISNFYGKKNQKVGMIWIDTHPDINTPDTSTSRNIFGMSVAALTGLIPGGVLESLQNKAPAVDLKNLVYVGLRDIDPPEKERIRSLGITTFTMKDVDILGLHEVMNRAIKVASEGTAGFVASFDVDVCDPVFAPGTGTTIRGGLTYRESHLAVEMMHDSKKMLAFELVELNPSLDKDFKTADLAVSIFESAVGKSIL